MDRGLSNDENVKYNKNDNICSCDELCIRTIAIQCLFGGYYSFKFMKRYMCFIVEPHEFDEDNEIYQL